MRSDGKAVVSMEELVLIIPEIAGETRVHDVIAAMVSVKRFMREGHSGRQVRLFNSR
jgi:hypothetical protein